MSRLFFPQFGNLAALCPAAGGGGPTTLVLDQFTDTNGTGITAHTIGPTNTPATSWTQSGGAAATISSNKLAGDGNTNVVKCDPGQADVTSLLTFSTDGINNTGLVGRVVDDSNLVLLSRLGTLYVALAGVFTLRASAVVSNADGDIWKMAWSGDTVTCYQNGVSLFNYTLSVGESLVLTGQTKCGIRLNADGTGRFDDFTVTQP